MPLGFGSSFTDERFETEKTLFLAEWAKGGGRGLDVLSFELDEVVTAVEKENLE